MLSSLVVFQIFCGIPIASSHKIEIFSGYWKQKEKSYITVESAEFVEMFGKLHYVKD